MLLAVRTNAGQEVVTLIDFLLASDTNYITHRAVRRLKLQSEKITLVVRGIGGTAMKVKTRRYRVKTPRVTERAHELVCYCPDEIAKVSLPCFYNSVMFLRIFQLLTIVTSHRCYSDIEPKEQDQKRGLRTMTVFFLVTLRGS